MKALAVAPLNRAAASINFLRSGTRRTPFLAFFMAASNLANGKMPHKR